MPNDKVRKHTNVREDISMTQFESKFPTFDETMLDNFIWQQWPPLEAAALERYKKEVVQIKAKTLSAKESMEKMK